MIEVFVTILVVIVVILVVVASIVVVIAVFAKNRDTEFEIFFQKFKKSIFFPAFSKFLHLYYKLTYQILHIRCSFADIMSQTL